MEYAMSLFFDKSTEEKIYDLINKIAETTGNKSFLEYGINPHMTISYFEFNKNIDTIIELLDKNISLLNMGIGHAFLNSIGIFIPTVLFISPVINNYILDFNKKINGFLI